MLDEALDAGARVEAVFVDAGTREAVVTRATAMGHRVFDLGPGVLAKVAGTATPQPVIAVVAQPRAALDELSAAGLLVVCVDVRDPGNLGTVLRTAEAAGAGGVVCCDGCVDVFNPKVVRASAGAVFHVPVVVGGQPVEVLERIDTPATRQVFEMLAKGPPDAWLTSKHSLNRASRDRRS